MAAELYRTSEKQEKSKWTLRNVVTFFFLVAAFVLLIIGEDKWLSREKIPSTFLSIDAMVVSSNIESNSRRCKPCLSCKVKMAKAGPPFFTAR